MQSPFGANPGYGQPPGGAPPMTSPFGAAPAGGGGVISSPFGAPGAAPPPAVGGPPPGGGFGPPPGPGAGVPPPPTAAASAAPPPMGGAPQPAAFGGGGVAPPPGAAGYPGAGYPGGGAAAPGPFGSAPAGPMMGGVAGPAGGMLGAPAAGQVDAYTEQVKKDLEQFNAPAHFLRSTVARLPNSASTKDKLKMPLGIVLQPLAPLLPEAMEEGTEPLGVPTVPYTSSGGIVRCKSCRTYVNPFVRWEDKGRRWTCNLCGASQVTPDEYFANLDETGKRMDRYQRPELCRGAIEYIAPGEYMVRPPQPPVFVFAIDVSYTAVVTGMLDSVVGSIKEAILSGNMPGGSRAQMGIITFDTSLHFYNLSSSLSQPQMLVVADLEDVFVPLPDDVLVPIQESESSILALLDALPQMFRDTRVNESCMGSAVQGAYAAMKHIGGKLLVFGACIPSVGQLPLKSTRDNPRLLGTEKEVELLRPVSDGYKDLSTELTRAQVSVELFLAPQAYVDLASIAPLAKFTGGDVRYYPGFQLATSGVKLRKELYHVLTRYMGWEAVMRIRVSRGWKITKFYGHLFIRGQDLLVVPNCHADQTFAVSIDVDAEQTPEPVCCLQSALLYTNSNGERRIRVNTWAALTTPTYTDIYGSIDVQAMIAMLSHQALEHSLAVNLAEGRNKLQMLCQQVIQAGSVCPTSEALQFLPLYIMGMLKSEAFKPTNDISFDRRVYIWMRLETLCVSQLAAYYYPRMMALHNAPDSCATLDENGHCTLPEMMNLTSESMTQDGVFLLEDGDMMMMWIGANVDAAFLQGLFGIGSFGELNSDAACAIEEHLEQRSDALSSRIRNILREVRIERPLPWMQLHVIKQGEPKERRFFDSLIEDRTSGVQSTYTEFLQRLGYRAPSAAPPAQPGGAPGAPGAMAPPMGMAAPGAMAPPMMRR